MGRAEALQLAEASSKVVVAKGKNVVKKLVEEHGGRVALESTPQKGTRVCVALPLPSSSEELED